MQSGHSYWWTAIATTGVILSAAYMLIMIQRVFYGHLGVVSDEIPGRDLNGREHLALWPFVVLFLLLGLCPTLFLKTIDVNGVQMADKSTLSAPEKPVKNESETYGPRARFVDPTLKQAVDLKDGKAKVAVNAPEGRLY
jgi:NADH-quinone oxidoreductase subunit M